MRPRLLKPQHVSKAVTEVLHWSNDLILKTYILEITPTRAGVKYILSNTNTNTKIWIFQIQIQIQIFSSTLIQIQIQRHWFKYIYKYVQPNTSAETVQDPKIGQFYKSQDMLMACVSLCLGDTWSLPLCISRNFTGIRAVGGWGPY